MKKILLQLCLMIFAFTSLKAQGDDVKKEETQFRYFFIQEMSSALNNVSLGDMPIKKLLYYSYKIVNKDSIVWRSYNYKNAMIDSVANSAFKIVMDSVKRKGNINLLKNTDRTFIPIVLLYKAYSDNGMDTDMVSIGPMIDAFNWDNNDNGEWNTEPVHRVCAPFIFRLPKKKEYYKLKQ